MNCSISAGDGRIAFRMVTESLSGAPGFGRGFSPDFAMAGSAGTEGFLPSEATGWTAVGLPGFAVAFDGPGSGFGEAASPAAGAAPATFEAESRWGSFSIEDVGFLPDFGRLGLAEVEGSTLPTSMVSFCAGDSTVEPGEIPGTVSFCAGDSTVEPGEIPGTS
jgi:hypothetical protein